MSQAILYSRLGRLLERRANCLEAIERLASSQNNSSSESVRVQTRYNDTLRAIEEINAQIDEAERQISHSEGAEIANR